MNESGYTTLYVTIYFLFYAFIAALLSLWIFVLVCRCYRLRVAADPPRAPSPPPVDGLEASAIERLPTFEFVRGAEGEENGKGRTECVVCLGVFEESETLRLMPRCGHVFHSGCVDVWLRSHTTCPYCRAAVVAPDGAAEVRVVVTEALPRAG